MTLSDVDLSSARDAQSDPTEGGTVSQNICFTSDVS